MERLVIGNFKGGVGKTTVAVNLAVALAWVHKRRVLLIDTDPSANITAHFKVRPRLALYHLLMEGQDLEKVVVNLPQYGHFYLLPSSKATQAAEYELAPQVGRERMLERSLASLSGFDYVLIDTAPSISTIAQNAFVYASQILIPISMDPMSLLGASSSISLARDIKTKLAIDYSIFGIVPTFVEPRLVITRLVMEAIRQKYPEIPVLPMIRSDTNVRKATALQTPIVDFDRKSRATEDFLKLAASVDELCHAERRTA